MSKLFNRVLCVLSIYSFLTTQSFAATELLYEGMQRTIGNVTLVCMSSLSDSDVCNCPEAPGTSSTTIALTAVITAVVAPLVKTKLENWYNEIVVEREWPYFCRYYSSAKMNIKIDLFNPAPPRPYESALKGLDTVLSAEGSGWDKYILLDTDEYVVGYKYVLLVEGQEGVAEIALVKDYKTPKNLKSLLSINTDIAADKIRKVEEIERIQKQEVGNDKNPYCYPYEPAEVKQEKPRGQEMGQAAPDDDERKQAEGDLEDPKKPAIGEPLGEAKLKDGVEEDRQKAVIAGAGLNVPLQPLNEEPVRQEDDPFLKEQQQRDQHAVHLHQFKEDLLKNTPLNVQYWLSEALGLHLQPKAQLKINRAGWFSHIDFWLPTGNFQLYLTLNKNLNNLQEDHHD